MRRIPHNTYRRLRPDGTLEEFRMPRWFTLADVAHQSPHCELFVLRRLKGSARQWEWVFARSFGIVDTLPCPEPKTDEQIGLWIMDTLTTANRP